MNILKFDELIIKENRQRKEFKKDRLEELANAIERVGLLNVPVLHDDGRTLSSGERRIRAMKIINERGHTVKHQGISIPIGCFPYTKLGELDEIRRMEAELSENIDRLDLTWQEKNQAIAALHELRKAQNPNHTKTATAREIAGDSDIGTADIDRVSDALLVSRNLHRPEVSKAKSTKEAKKLIHKEIEAEFKEELAKRAEMLGLTSRHVLLHASFETLSADDIPLFDCMIADPPYGVEADTTFGDMSELDHEYDDSYDNAMQRYRDLAHWSYGLSKPQAHIYVFFEPKYFMDIRVMFENAGWWVWDAPLIWYKGNKGLLPHPHHGPRRTYETILYAIKGKKPTAGVYLDVVTDIPSVMNKVHAAQKPVALYQNLLRRSCRPQDIVIDPCCGRGTIFSAATRESCLAYGIEKSEKSYKLAFNTLTGVDDNE